MKHPRLTKWIFLSARKCSALGWDLRHYGDKPTTQDAKQRMEDGRNFELLAHCLFPKGVSLKDERDIARAAAETARLMADRSVMVIYEATFIVNKIATRADVIQRVNGGWELYEIKSAMLYKDELDDDLAYTTAVMEMAGVEIKRKVLILTNGEYKVGMDDNLLFVEMDCTKQISQRVKEFHSTTRKIERATGASNRPKHVLSTHCKKSVCFKNDGLLNSHVDHILEIPFLSEGKLDQLNFIGIKFIKDIPTAFKLTDSQATVRQAVLTRKAQINATVLRQKLDEIKYPVSVLDFETFTSHIPIYPETKPYEQIATQFSLHVRNKPGSKLEHHEYLADDPTKDCQRVFIDTLLQKLTPKGSIIVYSAFEKRILKMLAKKFPDLKLKIQRVIDRLFDFQKVLRPGCFYHPDFRGRSSLKSTMPALVPHLSYEGLKIQDGATAVIRFSELAKNNHPKHFHLSPLLSAKQIKEIRQDLLDYCEMDTKGLFELYATLVKILDTVGHGQSGGQRGVILGGNRFAAARSNATP